MNFKKLILLAGVSLLPASAFAANSEADLIQKLKAENERLKQQIEALSGKSKKEKSVTLSKSSEAPKNSAMMKASADLAVQLLYDDVKASFKHIDPDLQPTIPFGDKGGYVGMSGRALLPLTDSFGVQFDAASDLILGKVEENSSYVSATPFAGHALYRTETYQIGAFAGLAQTDLSINVPFVSHIFGIEGQAYFGDFTLWGQAGQLKSSAMVNDSIALNATQLRSGIRYFVDDNTRLDVEGGYVFGHLDDSYSGSNSDISISFGGDLHMPANAIQWKLGLERQSSVGTFPVSIFVNYAGTQWLNSSGINTGCDEGCDSFTWKLGGTEQAVRIGFNLKFGTDTLRDQDRHGVNSDTNFATLPLVDQIFGVSSVSVTP